MKSEYLCAEGCVSFAEMIVKDDGSLYGQNRWTKNFQLSLLYLLIIVLLVRICFRLPFLRMFQNIVMQKYRCTDQVRLF